MRETYSVVLQDADEAVKEAENIGKKCLLVGLDMALMSVSRIVV